MEIFTKSEKAAAAQREAFDRDSQQSRSLLHRVDNNNELYLFTTRRLLGIEHQPIPYHSKPYEEIIRTPSTLRPATMHLAADVSKPGQNVQVNETLSINWEDPHPRVLWDGGSTIGESSCVSCGHCVTVLPMQRPDGKIHARACGIPHGPAKDDVERHDRCSEGVEPETGYGAILKLSEAESHMRELRIRRTKTVCTYCGVGCSFDV